MSGEKSISCYQGSFSQQAVLTIGWEDQLSPQCRSWSTASSRQHSSGVMAARRCRSEQFSSSKESKISHLICRSMVAPVGSQNTMAPGLPRTQWRQAVPGRSQVLQGPSVISRPSREKDQHDKERTRYGQCPTMEAARLQTEESAENRAASAVGDPSPG